MTMESTGANRNRRSFAPDSSDRSGRGASQSRRGIGSRRGRLPRNEGHGKNLMPYFALLHRDRQVFEKHFRGRPPELVVLAVDRGERWTDAVYERNVVEAGDRNVRRASDAPLPQ